jgi:hypothetical protein
VTETSVSGLRAIRAQAKADLDAVRARRRNRLADQYLARAWWAQRQLEARTTKDEAILAALRAGQPIRGICRALRVGPNRVCRLRALLMATEAATPDGRVSPSRASESARVAGSEPQAPTRE